MNSESRPHPMHTFAYAKSPRTSNVPISHSIPQLQTTLGSDIGSMPTSSPRPTGYPSQVHYSPHRAHPPHSAFAPPHWDYDDRRKSFPRQGSDMPYSDSVKRHLDIYESELTVNEVSSPWPLLRACMPTMPRLLKVHNEHCILPRTFCREPGERNDPDYLLNQCPVCKRSTMCCGSRVVSPRRWLACVISSLRSRVFWQSNKLGLSRQKAMKMT